MPRRVKNRPVLRAAALAQPLGLLRIHPDADAASKPAHTGFPIPSAIRRPSAFALIWAGVFIAIGFVVWRRLDGITLNLLDMDAYWNAAVRIREGQPLYDSGGRLDGESIYRYAPWFAYAWVPLTYLPKALVGGAWASVLAVASIACVLPAMKTRHPFGIAFGVLCIALLAWQTAYGNVHALLVAALVYGVHRPSGPVWIAWPLPSK